MVLNSIRSSAGAVILFLRPTDSPMPYTPYSLYDWPVDGTKAAHRAQLLGISRPRAWVGVVHRSVLSVTHSERI